MKPDKALAAIEKYRLTLFAPAREGGAWLARTNGGIHDPRPMGGTGSTPAAAIEDAVRGGPVVLAIPDAPMAAASESFEARRRLDDEAYRGTIGDASPEPVADDDAFVDPLG